MPSFYRKIDVRMWGDGKFRGLTSAKPNAQTLWTYLLTGPHTTAVPGLWCFNDAGAAKDLGWLVKPLRERFRELSRNGMARVDFDAGVVWVPKVINYRPPSNPNEVTGWELYLSMVPDCPLKDDAIIALAVALADRKKGFAERFAKLFAEGLPKQDKDQDQDQEEDEDQEEQEEGENEIDQWGRPVEADRFNSYWKACPKHKKTKGHAMTLWGGFLAFMDAYPIKVAPAQAWSAWLKHEPPLEGCLEALKIQTKYRADTERTGKWCAELPHPGTWLAARRWEDERQPVPEEEAQSRPPAWKPEVISPEELEFKKDPDLIKNMVAKLGKGMTDKEPRERSTDAEAGPRTARNP